MGEQEDARRTGTHCCPIIDAVSPAASCGRRVCAVRGARARDCAGPGRLTLSCPAGRRGAPHSDKDIDSPLPFLSTIR